MKPRCVAHNDTILPLHPMTLREDKICIRHVSEAEEGRKIKMCALMTGAHLLANTPFAITEAIHPKGCPKEWGLQGHPLAAPNNLYYP